MAGYVDRTGTSISLFGSLGKGIRKLANLGMDYDDMVVKQSRAVGVTEAEFGNAGYLPQEFLYSLAMTDIGQKKFIAYFEKDYKSRRDYLRRFAMNGEIDFIVETIADEAVVFDEKNYFCSVDTSTLNEYLEDEKEKEIRTTINEEFKRLYACFHFKDSHDAWHYFKKFLIDGFLSFEIIFDREGKKVIGFKELDALSLRPGVQKMDDGSYKKVWVQYEDVPSLKRELLDTQVIYISYAKGNFVGRLSYVERLVRSFNLLRIMENSRIIWNVMNSSYRLKMVVPIGTKSPQKAKESLAEMLNIYKEDIALNFDSGELTINGKPTMQFYKNYLFPSKNGEQPEIETIGGDGPDLSDTDALKYFYDKLRQDSKIPYNRFDNESPGQVSLDGAGMDRDEVRFAKFINRLRAIFQEILLKPLWVQIALEYPELADDNLIKANLGLKFNADNIFEEAKQMDIMDKRANFIQTMQGITVPEMDDTGMMNDVPYFNAKFLIQKYMKLSSSDIATNEKMQEKKAKEDEEKKKKAEDDGGLGF
jgi:hypothetical protein